MLKLRATYLDMVDQDRNGDRQIYFNGRYEYSSVDEKMGVISDLEYRMWHGCKIRGGNVGGGAWKMEITNGNT